MRRIMTSIGCGHSRPFYFTAEEKYIKTQERFPVDVRVIGGQMYVIDPLDNPDSVAIGDEITAINGRPIESVMEDILLRIPVDGNAIEPKLNEFNISATSYLTYALGFPESYEVQIAGRNSKLALNPLTTFEHKPLRSPNDLCREDLCYQVDNARNIGVMTIHSFAFYGERSQQIVDFVADAFEDLAANNRSGLIIDMRDNGGGSGLAANWILRRIATEPYQYWSAASDPRGRDELFELQKPVDTGFNGPTTILMNEATFSVVPHFLALVKEHGMATLVGTPAGGTKSTNDGKRQYVSKNTDYQYTIARMIFEVDAPSLSAEELITPDILIKPTLDDILLRQDSVLEKALSLAGKSIKDRKNFHTDGFAN
jgi:C-terminal processing protease CtpA/Prc